MNLRTRICLVALQVCIGWHLFYEGVWKIQQRDAWSSKGYLRAATGPFALPIRGLAGDPDVAWQNGRFFLKDTKPDFLTSFEVKPFDSMVSRENRKLHQHVPDVIDKEWDAYFARFVKHYQLDDPERRDQRVRAEAKLLQAKGELVGWLLEGVKKTKPTNFEGTADVPLTTPERIQAYRDKLKQVAELERGDSEAFGTKAPTAKIQKLQTEAKAIRDGLQSDLDTRTAQMQRVLFWEVLTPEQRRMERMPATAVAQQPWGDVSWLDGIMEPTFARLNWTWPKWDRMQWIDWCVRWGLTMAGVGLMLGLFTRTACAIGIALLLLFYLAMPPFPGAPESPAGHYLFINYNIIESFALLLIAVSDPASRYGLDAWMPFRWLKRRRQVVDRSQPWPST